MNCDSHDNYDPTGRQGDGENADGFGVHYQFDGDTTKFYGCRAWWNSDDGFDVLAQEFPVVVENSYAMGNGYIHYGTSKPPSFLKLKKGSRAIDKGEDLGFPFVGDAPDLGAFEYGMSSSSVASSGSVAELSSGTARIMPQRTPDGETPARKGYRDLKGRHYEKLVRYRVMF
ncbi:hypothetical protein [Fibrobacter sp.]|uniref:right-handed parallel beta-helix repeat-containing protein n=1 Tax=Fibrobacter sp. TaxID=35828 RepID=UPI0025BFC684|nr:hypothetical protein [Fibrobacter sp.]